MRGETEGAHPAAERRAEGHPGSDAGHCTAGEAHQEAAADLGVHEALSRRDELQHHRQGGQGDPAYGGKTL